MQGKEVTLETALAGNAIPLHAGAEKYYKEIESEISTKPHTSPFPSQKRFSVNPALQTPESLLLFQDA